MQLRCILCDRSVEIDDETAMAKRARHTPGFVFVCRECQVANVKRYGPRSERLNPILNGRRRWHGPFRRSSRPRRHN